jgi:rRNA maturation RNase YbeY
VADFCGAVLRCLDEEEGVLTILFVSSARIRSLNNLHRGADYPTDVLSYSYGGESVEGHRLLGDIVISPEVASEQARRYGTTLEREVRRLLVHGILHLLGYDHERDRGEMADLQRRLLRRKSLTSAPDLLRLEGV